MTVRDAQSHVFHFTRHVTLAGGAYVRVHTGKGTNTATSRYWELGYRVWNNRAQCSHLPFASEKPQQTPLRAGRWQVVVWTRLAESQVWTEWLKALQEP
jgi:hypothetical protein